MVRVPCQLFSRMRQFDNLDPVFDFLPSLPSTSDRPGRRRCASLALFRMVRPTDGRIDNPDHLDHLDHPDHL